MKPSSALTMEILNQVRIALSEHQRSGGGRHLPQRLRLLATSAVDYGHCPGAVGKVLGVHRASVLNWCKKEGIIPQTPKRLPTPAVELKVVKSRNQAEPMAEKAPVLVRILFRGGAILECPVSLVTADLVAALNGGTS